MQDVLVRIDEVLALLERRISEMSDPEAVAGMRRAMALVCEARAVLEGRASALVKPKLSVVGRDAVVSDEPETER